MSPSARYWRASGGYQDVPIPAPASPPTRTWRAEGGYQDIPTTPAKQSQMYWPPWYCFQWPGQQYVRGPVPVDGVYAPMPWCTPPGFGWPTGATPPPSPYAVTAPKPEEKKEEPKKKEDKKEEKKLENPYAPPKLDEGVNYMFHTGHTMLHIFSKAAPIWEEKYHKQELKFKMFKTPTTFTPKLIIEKVLCKSGDDCKGWVVTEAHERGDGVWSKGMSVEYTSDKADSVLPKFGWSTKRGDSLPPVWLVVHKA